MKPLISSSIHLINPFAIAIELECGCVSNLKCCLWALIYISINKTQLWKFTAQLPKSRKNLVAHSAPVSLFIPTVFSMSMRTRNRLTSKHLNRSSTGRRNRMCIQTHNFLPFNTHTRFSSETKTGSKLHLD